MSLSDDFHAMLTGHEDDASVHKQIAAMVLSAPETPESNGLLALMYHEGIGVAPDCDRCFALAENAATEGGDGLGCFLMGYMCDSGEVPDGRAAEYGPDDAERFYLKCAASDSRWAEHAHLWLGDWRAAEAIATLYEERLAALADRPADDWDRRRCEREIESWRRLAALTRERQQKQDGRISDS